MMRVARVAAQAKINLVLRIGPADATGYHELITQFLRIDLADDVTVRVGGAARSLDCAGPRLPAAGLGPMERNLAWRAAVSYAERAGWPDGFAIEITKHIPVGGGLGGGSADAGAVLRALDALAPAPLGGGALQELARPLGADVPFLTGESAGAVATARGDVWRPFPQPPLPARDLLLAIPDFAIATADAYRWLDEAGGGSLPDPYAPGLQGFDLVKSWAAARSLCVNDFEGALEPRYPELRTLRESLLAAGAVMARLSGSGSTVFGVFESVPPRDLAVDALVLRTRTSERVVGVEARE